MSELWILVSVWIVAMALCLGFLAFIMLASSLKFEGRHRKLVESISQATNERHVITTH